MDPVIWLRLDSSCSILVREGREGFDRKWEYRTERSLLAASFILRTHDHEGVIRADAEARVKIPFKSEFRFEASSRTRQDGTRQCQFEEYSETDDRSRDVVKTWTLQGETLLRKKRLLQEEISQGKRSQKKQKEMPREEQPDRAFESEIDLSSFPLPTVVAPTLLIPAIESSWQGAEHTYGGLLVIGSGLSAFRIQRTARTGSSSSSSPPPLSSLSSSEGTQMRFEALKLAPSERIGSQEDWHRLRWESSLGVQLMVDSRGTVMSVESSVPLIGSVTVRLFTSAFGKNE